MKRASNVIGCMAAALVLTTVFFKINHLPGATPMLILTGGFLSIYYPVYILSRFTDSETGITPRWITVAACVTSLLNLGLLFKIQHWPGASVMLILSLATFGLIFVPMLLKYKLSDEVSENKLMNLSGGLGLALTTLGILFKLQHWPFAMILLLVGITMLVIGYLPLYLRNEKNEQRLRNTFFVVVLGGVLVLLQARVMQTLSAPVPAVETAAPPVCVK